MFLHNLVLIASQVVILYIIAAVGFVGDKTGVFTRSAGKKVTDLLFNIILPVAVVKSFIVMERTPERIKGLGLTLLFSILAHAVAIGVGTVIFRDKDRMLRGLYRYAAVFTNAAFLALPLAQSVIGDEGVFYCSVYVGVFNAFAFTYGIYEISGHKAKVGVKKVFLNPGMISLFIGVPLFLWQPNLPEIIMKPVELIASVNSPLAMIVFGTFLAHANFKRIFTNKKVYIVSFLGLIVVPLLMLGIFKIFGVGGNMRTALAVSVSAPAATNTAMYAGKFDNDTAIASEVVAGSSILSILTMPVIVAAAMAI